MRVLFVSGEVAPFTNKSEIANLVRELPEYVHENHEVETRIMMPRYGLVSERRNRLHEVIRLSGNNIQMGESSDELRVKVASIPGIRLQVYFMDSARMFKRKGIFMDKSGTLFPDNQERSMYFGRSVIRTIMNLGWRPDVVHAFGWMAGSLPYLLKTEFGSEELFADSKVVFTPQKVEFDGVLTAEMITQFGLPPDERASDQDVSDIGTAFADAVVLAPSSEAGDADQFGEDVDANGQMAMAIYERVLAGVPA